MVIEGARTSSVA